MLSIIVLATGTSAASAAGLLSTDKEVYKVFPEELRSLAGKGLARDESGLLGRNRRWGRLYSPRFQLGAGRALRISLVASETKRAKIAYLAIKKGSEGIEHNGYIRTTVPESLAQGRELSEGDIASAGAFFLGDACLGIKALETATSRYEIADKEELERVKQSLKRGFIWLLSQREVLFDYDRRAPNRLFFDALAFQACGSVFNKETTIRRAAGYVRLATSLQASEGYFLEGGGWDTSYQAVSIHVGTDLLLAGFESTELEDALYRAAKWLAKRIDKRGRIDSTGNTRTCSGGESFLGSPKKLALDSVFLSMAYPGVMRQDRELLSSAKRVSAWYRAHPEEDPCYGKNS